MEQRLHSDDIWFSSLLRAIFARRTRETQTPSAAEVRTISVPRWRLNGSVRTKRTALAEVQATEPSVRQKSTPFRRHQPDRQERPEDRGTQSAHKEAPGPADRQSTGMKVVEKHVTLDREPHRDAEAFQGGLAFTTLTSAAARKKSIWKSRSAHKEFIKIKSRRSKKSL